MARSDQFHQGKRAAFKWAITWLHERASSMNDPHAKTVLDAAAFTLGNDAKRAALNIHERPEAE